MNERMIRFIELLNQMFELDARKSRSFLPKGFQGKSEKH